MSLTDTWAVLTRTGGNYTDDGSDVSDSTYRPKVVHLGQYVPHGSAYFISTPEVSLIDGSDELIDYKQICDSAGIIPTNHFFGSAWSPPEHTAVSCVLALY
jgi:hypothetical protein